jgi:hypothetical protein
MSTYVYVIYILALACFGFVMRSADIKYRDWQWWVLIFIMFIIYTCGYIRGGC